MFRVAAILSCVTSFSCVCSAPSERTPTQTTLELVDGKGRTVRLAAPARRIASLSPSATEILYAVGCGGQIVLRGKASNYPAAVTGLPATDGLRLAPEHIIGFRPDLVLLAHHDARGVQALEALRVPVGIFEPRTISEVFRDVTSIGELCGAPTSRVRRLLRPLRRQLAELRRRVAQSGLRPTVYVELDGSDPLKPWTLGGGSFMADLLRQAGGSNIFARLKRPYVQVSAEAVVAKRPEVILLAGGSRRGAGAKLRARLGWQQVPAVLRDRVIDHIDPDLLSRPGPRMITGLAALVEALHPRRPPGSGGRP
jgi:ABC-type Fe3+-hydroxamate transport system substrate-binding protein